MMQRFAILLLTLSAIQFGAVAENSSSSNLRATNKHHAVSHIQGRELTQRRELSWWSSLMQSLHCGPLDPLHHHSDCHTNGSGSSSTTTTTTETADGDTSTNSASGTETASDGTESYNGGGDNAENAEDYYFAGDYEYSNDEGTSGGWTESTLDSGGTKGAAGILGGAAGNILPFLIGAFVAGILGAVLVVSRKRRQEEDENHPLEGSIKRRMKLFNGGVFRNKRGSLDNELSGDGTPAFIEISSVRSPSSVNGDMSVKSSASRMSSYKAPQTVFENESEESEF